MTFDDITNDGRLWNEITEKLRKQASPTPSRWREEAEFRTQNKSWLRYSQKIAMMMLDRMEELGLTQKMLATQMGCSQQYISKVLKGKENLSLETLCKIEDALSIRLVQKHVNILSCI